MIAVLQPWQVAFTWVAGWVSQRQQLVMEYLCVEDRFLCEQIPEMRILLTDDQRRMLEAQGNELGRMGLQSITTLFTPETNLGGGRQLVAQT